MSVFPEFWRNRLQTTSSLVSSCGVTFAFDGVAAQIINSWRACRLHCLPPSFSLFTSLFPSFSYPPTPAPLAHLCLPNESVWLAVCCCQGAGEGDYSCRTGPGSGLPELTTGKKGFWKIPPKQQLPPSLFLFFSFSLLLFLLSFCIVLQRSKWKERGPDQILI